MSLPVGYIICKESYANGKIEKHGRIDIRFIYGYNESIVK